MKKLIIISLTLILASGILVAQRFDGMPCNEHGKAMQMNQARPMMKHDGMMNCLEELKLTDAQKNKFEELRVAFQKTENSLAAEIENLRIDMKTAIKAENFKLAKDLNKQISAKEATLQDARLDFMAARMKELSAEQKQILKDNMRPMMMQGNGMGHNCMGPGMMQMRNRHQGNWDNCDNCNETSSPKDSMPKSK
jgi:hypothetical protein